MEGGDAVGDGLGGGGLFLSLWDAEEGVAGWGVEDAGLVDADFFLEAGEGCFCFCTEVVGFVAG